MKKSLPLSTSILTLGLIGLIVLGVSTRRSGAAGFPSILATWITQSKQKPAAPLVGPVTVTATAGTLGPTDYATLKDAFDAINAGTHQGTITISIVGDTTEAAPAVLNASGSGSASYATIGIQPSGGAARTISGAIVAGSPLIDFNGADNVTIDGLNTGGNSLTISNSQTGSTAGTSTIRYINDATSNTIQNATVNGAATGASTGTIIFSSTTGTTGNDNNTVTACNIGPVGATFPTNGIFSSGTTTSVTTRNSGIQVTNNNIFDFFNNTTTIIADGIIASGSTDWTITGNSFYQTATRTFAAATTGFIGISIADTSGVNFVISNNFIGGSAPSAGGTAWTQTGAVTHTFIGIRTSVGTTTPTSLQNNTIKNISISTSSASTINAGISAVAGSINVGTTTGNTIGSTAGTGSIVWTGAGAGAQFTGILSGTGTPGVIAISNNTIGGITVAGAGTTVLRGINTQGAGTSYTISGNTVGSTTIANNITSSVNSTMAGIISSSTSTTVSITGNIVANLTTTGTSTSNTLHGIEVSGSSNTISGNTVRNLTSSSTATGSGSTATMIGISMNTTTATQSVSGNTIHSLSNSAASATVGLVGIYYAGGTSGTNVVEKNLIHSLSTTSTGAAIIRGIYCFNGSAAYRNNMIRLGIDAAGSSLTSAALSIEGFRFDAVSTSVNLVNFNSVFIGGTSVATGAVNTTCYIRVTTETTTDIRDNILVNNRSNSTGTGKHYLINLNAITAVTSNFNDFNQTGTGAVFGVVAAVDSATFAAWKTATTQDASSFFSDPMFVNPTGTAGPTGLGKPSAPEAVVDLHINPAVTTVVEGNGLAIGSVTDDFDGQTRSTLTPTDIGADAGNFLGVDLTPPTISYTPLANTTSTSNRALASTITDGTGVPTSGIGLPVIYYRKGVVGAFSSTQSSSGGGSTYNFTIDYSLVSGGSVTVGDTIQYYVVAQDTAATPNVIANPSTGASGYSANPPAASTPPTTPNSYMIVPAISGTKTVGTGGDYPTLTGAGGLFADINSKVATSDLVIQIISDLTTEDGTNGLNPLAEEPAGSNFTVKIFPTGANRAISGTNVGALIRLNAADRVTIDGSIGGTGTDRSMAITNTNIGTSSAVVWMQSNGADGATNNTIKNLNVAGSGNTQTLIGIGSGSSTVSTSSLGTSNNNNTIQNNNISKTQYGIFSQGASAASKNTGNVITQNLMNTASPNNVSKGGIQVGFESGIQITRNTIDGVTQASSPDVFGIALGLTSISTTSFTGNEVTGANVSRNFIGTVTNTGTFSAVGISVASATSGTNQIANNSIYGVGANGTSGDFGAGIFLGGGTGSTTQVYFNAVSMTGTFTGGSYPNYGLAIGGTDPTVDVKDNIFYNTQANGTGVSFAIGTASATFANLTSNYNDFFVTAGGGTFKIGKIGSLSQGTGTEETLLSDWIAATGKDTPNTISVNPQFNSSTNLQPQTGSPVLDVGTSLSGVVVPYVDITGATRVDPPSLGAYETASDTAPPVITYTPLANTTSTANRGLSSVVITDGTGVNTTAGTRPRIYYKKSTDANAFVGNTSADNGWKFVETSDTSSPFSFTLDYSLLTSAVVVGDSIQYFVVAQDTAATPNVGINSGTFATAPTSVSLGAAQAPITGTINSYLISIAYTGSYNVGTAETITSLTNAGGLFQTINNGVLTGNVTINITSDLTVETGAVFLNQCAEEGAGGYTLTIKPSGAARTISGTSIGSGLVVLNGADRIVIDGSLSGGTDRSLTITNGNASGTVIWIASASATNGATNNTIKNCTISGNTGTTPVGGILSGSGVTLGNDAESPNSNNTIQNNAIFRAQNALYLRGNATTLDQNWMVMGNTLGSTVAADKLTFRGMLIGNAQTSTISGNTINGVSSSTSTSSTMSGIQAALKISGGTISGNKISDIKQNNTTGWGSNGIYMSATTTTSNLTISNNFISDVASQGFAGVTSSDNGYGIMIDSGGGYNIYYNSVNLNTNQVASGSITAAINIAAAVTTSGLTDLRHDTTGSDRRLSTKPAVPLTGSVDLRDNILVDGETVGTRYAVYDASTAAAAVFANIDFNDYFAQNVGFLTSARATLADWQSATGQDANSKAVDPVFVSSSDLHLQPTSPVLSMGMAIGTVTTDYDNDPRPASNPDIGADELVQAVAGTIPGGTFYNALTADGDSLGGNVSITNIIYLNGKLSTGANTLAIGCNATVSGGGASNYVIGNLKKTYCATGSKSFEVGTANGFSPVTVNVTAGTFPADFTTKAVQGPQPNIAVPAKALQRYWTLTATGVTADLTFNYLDPPDVPGTATEANFVIVKYDGSFSTPGGTVDAMANTASITGVTSFSDWTLAEPSAEPCPISTTPTSQNFPGAGGTNSFMVTADGNCTWDPVPNDAWIMITSVTAPSGFGHNGNGTVNYSVAANGPGARMGSITIGVQTFTVTQDSGCSFMLDSMSHNFVAPGGSSTVGVTATTGCGWTAVSNDAFIIVDSGTPGSGNGSVGYHVTANTGPARNGTMTIAGITFTVTQDAACAFNLSSMSQHFVTAGGMDSVDVLTGPGCTWMAVSNDAFITVNSGTPGNGNGTVGYTVAANVGPARMGTMTIAGITFTVTQDEGCTFTLSRDHQSFPGSAGSGSVDVTASDPGCPWTASTSATFIHITSGTPGTGNGTLNYTVDANPGTTNRSDTITVAGHIYTVYQGIDFLDVPSNNLFYTEIGILAARGVTLGCTQDHTMYCPNDPVLREQMAAFILRAKGEFSPPDPASQRFTDVPPENVFYNFIDRLAVLGITVGCNPPDNTMYCPGSAVTREQMSAFILRGLGEFSPPDPASQRFNDVPPGNVFYNFIDRMAVLNITLGCTPDHLFYCPSDPVTRGQMAAFLVRAFDL